MSDTDKTVDWYQRGTEALGKAQGKVEVATLLYQAAERQLARARAIQRGTIIAALVGIVAWAMAAWEMLG